MSGPAERTPAAMDVKDAQNTQEEEKVPTHEELLEQYFDPDQDKILDLEIRESDLLVVTYPKSGTIWMQQILLLLESKGVVKDRGDLNVSSSADFIPWIEGPGKWQMFMTTPDPRMNVSHLLPHRVPRGLRHSGKVIYVVRNPKDVLVSYFHFHNIATMLETPKDFNDFFDKFLTGDVSGGSWFDHVKSWYSQKEDMNMLIITYEELIQDLRAAVERIALFLGKELTDEQMANVVRYSTFNNMKKIPLANYELQSAKLFGKEGQSFMRKGVIGDWKKHFTVAQNERFDEVFKKNMNGVSLSFVWDQ